MAWGAVAGAAIGAIGPSLMGGGKESEQQQQQTVSKDPWAAAIPWLTENLKSGQNLQAQYAANPFSAQQQQSYGNQFANSDYMRQLTGSVLGQMNQQKPFDRTNPSAKPQGFQLPQMLQRSPTNSNLFSAPAATPAQAAPAAAPAAPVGDGIPEQYRTVYNGWRDQMQNQYGVSNPDQLSFDYYSKFYGGGPGSAENAGPGVGSY